VAKVLQEGKKTKARIRKRDMDDFCEPVEFREDIHRMNKQLRSFKYDKMKRLQELDLFVLDNSIRETTVGQLRGHTLEDKMEIYEEVKKSKFDYIIVESFHHITRLGDLFLEKLKTKGEDMSTMFAFSELIESIDKNKVPEDKIPIGLTKSKKLGIKNVVIELDLVYHGIDYKKFNARAMCSLLMKRLEWIGEHLGENSLTCINIRDFSDAMKFHPSRVFKIVRFISTLQPPLRPFAILYEELGKYLPEELGAWTTAVRREMTNSGWVDGHLLVHVHQQWGMSDSTQLECLAAGADGIWAGLCEEGAAMGHASSCVTILNLIRIGNKKVKEKYNCTYLREAAQRVTKITTDCEPHPKQHVYGARALDIIFGFDPADPSEFNFADFLGVKPEIRITTLASPEMIVEKLQAYFGEDDQFTLEIGRKMKENLVENLKKERKEESHSRVGLAMLFDQSGGQLTKEMSDIIEKDKENEHIEELIRQIKESWNYWDAKDGEEDDQLTFDAFYNGFMAPYFGCYRCEDSRRGLKAIDMDDDGLVDWKEFALYLRWAGRQYPETKTKQELLDIAFRYGLIPAMQDEILTQDDFVKVPELSDTDSSDSEDENDVQNEKNRKNEKLVPVEEKPVAVAERLVSLDAAVPVDVEVGADVAVFQRTMFVVVCTVSINVIVSFLVQKFFN